VDGNTITAVTPPGMSEGPVSVDVEILSSYVSLTNGYTYREPSISSIVPASGSIDGGTFVTITGNYFTNDATVAVNGTPAENVNVVDSQTITAITPASSTPGPVAVEVSVGQGVGYASGNYTYLEPSIVSVTPQSGPESGGTEVTITGTLFSPLATVEFDYNSASSVTFIDSNTLVVTTPGGTGTVDVTVTTSNSQSLLSQAFTYTAIPPPQIGAISPQSGDSNGGMPITITGTDFQTGLTASLGNAPITNIVVVDSTTITGNIPALPPGTYSLTVTNPDGQFSTLANAYNVTQAPVGFPAGDLAPRGNPDGQINVADFLLLQRIVIGYETPTSYEELVGDVAPLNNPDGQLNAGDLVVLMRAVMGEITLPPVFDNSPPQISILAPTNGNTIAQTSVAVIGALDELATVLVNGINLGLVTSFNSTVALHQGANAITVTATDASGNTATATLDVTADSRAPVSPNLSKLTVSDPVAGQVSFTGPAGSVEPETTVRLTNTATNATVTVVADGAGAFAQQFSASAGDVIQIALVDAAGNTSEPVAYTVGAQVQIVSPTQNAAIGGSAVGVSGIYSGGSGSGITVNTVPACVFANTFYINNLPQQTGSNTLTAILTEPTGSTDQHSIQVTNSGTPVPTLGANNDCGVAPLVVNFDIGTAGVNVQQIDIDFDGNGVPDLSTTDINAALSHTYTSPGVYPATAWILDDQGSEHVVRLNIVAQNEAAQNDLFQQIWTNFSTALAAGDAATALQSVGIQSRGLYTPVLQALAANLPEIAGDLSGIRKIQIGEDTAEYAVLTVVDGQVKTFVITFTKDADGIWRIASM
jgi:hypothetical protein